MPKRLPALVAPALALVLVLALTACSSSTATPKPVPKHVVITAAPAAALPDTTVAVTIDGLGAGTRTTITATARDTTGVTWSSSEQFTAARSGTVSLGQSASGTTYAGRDPMGLFDLMTPASSTGTDTEFISPAAGYVVTLRASVRGRTVATTTVRRTSPNADIVTAQLRPASSGIYGELDLPRHSTGTKPAVLTFGGSEGGLLPFEGRMLAAHGYPTLSLAYFKEPGLPQTLSRIPLEYFTKALARLRRQPGVDPKHVLVFGVSRGSEAALLLGAHFPGLVNGVVAGVPSSVANPAYPEATGAAWTLAGKAVPTVPIDEYTEPDPGDAPAAVIPVEQIRGPVFTVCAEADGVWPSCNYAAAITARLKAHHFRYPQVALRYSGVGHFIGGLSCCFSATAQSLGTSGGSVEALQTARRSAWPRLLRFLAAQ